MMHRVGGLRRVVSTALCGAMLLGMTTVAPLSAFAAGGGVTTRVSVVNGSPGAQATGGASSAPSVSSDGRFVAFASDATNLVPNDTNGVTDVFVRDRLTGTTERVSVNSAGAQGIGPSGSISRPSISADGNFVAFESFSPLVSSPSLAGDNVFVRDRAKGTTQLVSVAPANAAPSAGSDSNQPSISADGNSVAFASTANNLVASDNNGAKDIFVRNLTGGTTTRVSVGGVSGTPSSAEWTWESDKPSISGDGRYVAFRRQADTSDPLNPLYIWEIWVRDTTAGTSRRLSNNAISPTGLVLADSDNPAISQNGAYVAFDSGSPDLTGAQGNGMHAVIRMSTSGGTGTLVSQSTSANEGNGASSAPAISSDGRYVAFQSDATNLDTDSNGHTDIFVRDCTLNTTAVQSVSTAGAQGNGDSITPAISSDGQLVAFESAATNLVSSDSNSYDDVFARLIDTSKPVTTAQYAPSANAAGWWNAHVTVTLNATDSGSGVASTSYNVGGGSVSYAGPFAINTEGTTNLTYFSTDLAGNSETPNPATIKIDTIKPTLALDTTSGSSHAAPFSVGLSSAPSDSGSGIDNAKGVEFQLDGQSWIKENSVGLVAGTHTVSARVSDIAGNQTQVDLTGVQVTNAQPDHIAPHTVLSNAPAPGVWVNATTAPKSLVATDDGSGVSFLTYWLNNPPQSTPATTPESIVSFGPLPILWQQGPNTLHFFSTDAAVPSNIEATQTATVLFDSIAPTIHFGSASGAVNSGAVFYTGGLTVTAGALDGTPGTVSGVNSTQMKVDGATAWTPVSSVAVGLGTHTVYAQATDNAGNESAVSSVTFTVNPAPIAVSLSAPKVSGKAVHTTSTKIIGSVSPGHSVRVAVAIQKYSGNKPKAYKTVWVTASSSGAWSFKLKFKKGTYRMRASTAGTTSWKTGLSTYRTIKIK